MVQSKKQLRASLYFSRTKDKDIVSHLHLDNIEQGEINWKIKELLRDGIKFRQGGYDASKSVSAYPPSRNNTTSIPINDYKSADNAETLDDIDNDIVLERKEMDENDILDKLEVM